MAAADLAFELVLPEGASAGSYRFLGMTGREALGRLFEFHIRFGSDKPTIDPLKVLGEKVRLSMQTGDGQRHFHAYITGFEYRGPIDLGVPAGGKAVPQYQYAVVARPWLWFLTRTSDCRVFQKLKVPEICDLIFSKYAGMVKKKLDADYQPWDYCVQYRETDFNFVSRLMEQEGLFYFFEHEKTDHALKVVDLHGPTTATKQKIPYVAGERAVRSETESIFGWTMQHEVQPGAYAIKDYDFKKPSSPLLSIVKQPWKHTQGAMEIFDYPGEFETAGEGDHYVRVRLEELRTQYETIHASCNVRTIAAGDVFELSNPEQAGAAAKVKYLVTEAAYDLSAGLESGAGGARFICAFSCIRADEQFRSQRTTPKPFVQGPQTAMIVGPAGDEIHTDEHGRVKVKFHWDRTVEKNENSSCWIRVSHPWAGKGWGSVSIPRIGQEVIVDFLEGDPDQPIITGRVYNAETKAPFSLPGDAVISGLKSNTHKGKGYNEMSMNDTAGKEKIIIHGQYDMETTIQHDDTHTVKTGNKKIDVVTGTHTETIKGATTITIVSGAYKLDVQANTHTHHVSADVIENYDANQSTTVAHEVLIDAGDKITLQTGASSLTLESNGKITLHGKNIVIIGDTDMSASAPKVSVSGDDEAKFGVGNQSMTCDKAQVVVSGAAINSSATGKHEITGAMVKIN